MAGKARFDITKVAPDAYKAFVAVEELIGASKFDPILKHLVKLRISQINGCAFCVNMHTTEARDDNETQERLDHVTVWQHVDLFTDAEKAALAWAEALTIKGTAPSLDLLHSDLEKHFDEETIALLSLVVIMINNWNRIMISSSYKSF